MKKSQLIKTFPTVAESAIQKKGEEWLIVGKYGVVAHLRGDYWDLWIGNPDDLRKGLSKRKHNAILKKLRKEATFTELENEAYATLEGTELIENNLDLIGIKRRRQLSQEDRERRKQLMNDINAENGERVECSDNITCRSYDGQLSLRLPQVMDMHD